MILTNEDGVSTGASDANLLSLCSGNRSYVDLTFNNEIKGRDEMPMNTRKNRHVEQSADHLRFQVLRTDEGVGGNYMLHADHLYRDQEFRSQVVSEKKIAEEQANILNHNDPGAGNLAAGFNRVEEEVVKQKPTVDIEEETPRIVLVRNPKSAPIAPKPPRGNAL